MSSWTAKLRNIAGSIVNPATEEKQDAAQTRLNLLGTEATLVEVRDKIEQLKGFTDGLEALLGTTNANTDATRAAVVVLQGYADTLEALLGTSNANTEATRAAIATLQGLVDQLEGYTDGLEGALTTLNAKDFATEATLALLKARTDLLATEATLAAASAKLPATLGQKASAASLAAVLSTEQEALFKAPDTSTTGNITGADQSITLPLPNGISSTGFQFTGTFVGTVIFESSQDGGVTYNPRVYRGAGILNNLQTGTSAFPSEWRGNSAQMTHVRVRCTAYTSGALGVRINAGSGEGAVFLNAAIPIGQQSVGNSYNAALTAGANSGGTYENLENVAEVSMTAIINQTGTLTLRWSQDGNALFVQDVINLTASTAKYLTLRPRAQYLKAFITNTSGSTASQARLETLYRAVASAAPAVALGALADVRDGFLPPLSGSIQLLRKAVDSYDFPAIGAGAVAANVPRVTLATDDAAIAAMVAQLRDAYGYYFGQAAIRHVGGSLTSGVASTQSFRLANPAASGKTILLLHTLLTSTDAGAFTLNKNGTLSAPTSLTPWGSNFAGADTTVALAQIQTAAFTAGTALANSLRVGADIPLSLPFLVLLPAGTSIGITATFTVGASVHVNTLYAEF